MQLLLLLSDGAALGLWKEASSQPVEKESPGENDPDYSRYQPPDACVCGNCRPSNPADTQATFSGMSDLL